MSAATTHSAAKRVAFVTGASYGIGAATAHALARDGFDVAVSATRIENLADTMTKLEVARIPALAVALDLRSQASIEHAMDAVISSLGRIDVLVNNAGTVLSKPALEVTNAEWDLLMSTNLTGTFFMSQQVGRHLIGSGRSGCIISITSTHGVVGTAERSTYGISKAALIHMSKMLAIEWAQHGIRVNTVAPGRLSTPSPLRAASAADPKYVQAKLDRIPLHRFCTAEEVAAAVSYLASPQAEYITGHTLMLDGGLTAY
jgi:NAD(P)-dependent dehydrogenase (short-subunit alcohol dehydrogenase family)